MKKTENFLVLYDGRCRPLFWGKIAGETENKNFFIVEDKEGSNYFFAKSFCKIFSSARDAKQACIRK